MLIFRILLLCAALCAFASLLFNALAYGFKWWTHVPSCEDDEPLSVAEAVRAFVGEAFTLLLLLLSWPLGLAGQRDLVCAGSPGNAIVLIHGWGLNAASLWLLRRRLIRRGYGPVWIFAYKTWRVNVERAAEQLRDALAVNQRTHPVRVTLIGHSLGGLVARYCLRRYPPHGVRRLITLGTPHQGTIAARFGPHTRALQPDSPLMKRLNAADHVPDQFDVIAIASAADALIVPSANAEYRGAFNISIRGIGHNALLFSSRVFALIEENVRAQGASTERTDR